LRPAAKSGTGLLGPVEAEGAEAEEAVRAWELGRTTRVVWCRLRDAALRSRSAEETGREHRARGRGAVGARSIVREVIQCVGEVGQQACGRARARYEQLGPLACYSL